MSYMPSWWTGVESNRRRVGLQPTALPSELPIRVLVEGAGVEPAQPEASGLQPGYLADECPSPIGAGGRHRTCTPPLTKQLLCQLSHASLRKESGDRRTGAPAGPADRSAMTRSAAPDITQSTLLKNSRGQKKAPAVEPARAFLCSGGFGLPALQNGCLERPSAWARHARIHRDSHSHGRPPAGTARTGSSRRRWLRSDAAPMNRHRTVQVVEA